MSIIRCKHCEKSIDTDFDAEHEEECGMSDIQKNKEVKPQIGDRIKVELNSGEIMDGTFDIHPLADECVKNQFGFPINYKRIIRIIN